MPVNLARVDFALIDWSIRAKRALDQHFPNGNLAQLEQMSDRELLQYPGLGGSTVREIRYVIRKVRDICSSQLGGPVALKFKRLAHGQDLPLPAYKTPGAAGLDICSAEDICVLGTQQEDTAYFHEKWSLSDKNWHAVATGFAVEVPEGYELQVRPRSGLAAEHGISVLNTPGTIDSDYRGEIKIILVNHAKEAVCFARGERIAQLILTPVTRAQVSEVEELSDTERGAGGLGSTGR